MKEALNRIIDDFHERDLPMPMPRDKKVPKVAGKAQVVVGMRRTGKTWFCYQQMQDLMGKGVEKERILYINFEDERLLPFTAGNFDEILETYYRKFPAFKSQNCFLFLDEVQRIEGWDKFVRRILDSERIEIWITGSSSKLLSSEIATSLRGRSITTEVFPFSFKEYLRFHGTNIKSTSRFGSQTRASLQNMMNSYLSLGGFPEIQKYDDEMRRQALWNYLDVVILRDVIERYSVRNTIALRTLIRHITSAPATQFSINKFYNTLKSQGIACAKNDLYEFLDHLADAFLVYPIPIHARSFKSRQVNPRKMYVIDNGLLGAMSYQMTEDRGALLENLVFILLRGQGFQPEYYVTKDGQEIDFVLPAKSSSQGRLIQVCWSLENPDTRDREVSALRLAMKELRLKRATIITWLEEKSAREGVEIIPIWKWALDISPR